MWNVLHRLSWSLRKPLIFLWFDIFSRLLLSTERLRLTRSCSPRYGTPFTTRELFPQNVYTATRQFRRRRHSRSIKVSPFYSILGQTWLKVVKNYPEYSKVDCKLNLYAEFFRASHELLSTNYSTKFWLNKSIWLDTFSNFHLNNEKFYPRG